MSGPALHGPPTVADRTPSQTTKRRAVEHIHWDSRMEKALWYLLAGTRGGENRARIIRALDEQPRNANQLADELGVDYNTIRHHLEMLVDHGVVETSGDDYGEMYFLTDRFEHNRETFETVTDNMD
jgi:DNA-binding transcriptional ArsR family regulator